MGRATEKNIADFMIPRFHRFQSHRADKSRDLGGVSDQIQIQIQEQKPEFRVAECRPPASGDDLIAESQISKIQSVTSGHATKLMSADSRFQSPGGCGLGGCAQKQNPECRVSAACPHGAMVGEECDCFLHLRGIASV